MSDQVSDNVCSICQELIKAEEKTVLLTGKGLNGVNNAAKLRGVEISFRAKACVHTTCRRDFTNERRIRQDLKRSSDRVSDLDTSMTLRSSSNFDILIHCLYCGFGDTQGTHRRAKKEGCNSGSHKLVEVQTVELSGVLKKAMDRRSVDGWTYDILSRIGTYSDLPSAEAKYHSVCRSNYHSGRSIPLCFSSVSDTIPSKRGRSCDEERKKAFCDIMEHLRDSDQETITISDLMSCMNDILRDSDKEAYTYPYMKQCIIEYYGDEVTFAEVDGCSNVVTFTNTAAKIISGFHRQTGSNKDEKKQIIETAARLLQSDVKRMIQDKSRYPDTEAIETGQLVDYLPESLKSFLHKLLPNNVSETKLASLGHALIQTMRPRGLLSPLQLGLAVQLHHQFGSRFLIDTLFKLGFCSSYSEVQLFERNAAIASDRSTLEPCQITKEHCVQYMLDNADHNLRTLDGRNTFHGMGMMYSVTPAVKKSIIVPRLKVTDADLRAIGKVPIVHCPPSVDGMRKLLFTTLPICDYSSRDFDEVDWMWKASGKAGYQGFMQMVMKGQHQGKSSLIFLPMIDMSPNDTTCVYSSLCYVASHARRLGVTPVITFDQPLWWKALTIIQNEPVRSDLHKIVLRIGTFHLQMSYSGCIGYIMENTGMRQLLEVPYAENVVPHLMSGKAHERTVRCHQLVNAALNIMLERETCSMSLLTEHDLHAIREVCEEVSNGLVSASDPVVKRLILKYATGINATMTALSEKSQTAKLWCQYMELGVINRNILRAEREGDFSLHIQTLQAALPILAAAGHNLYIKTVHIYLQNMMELKTTNPEVLSHFENGRHAIRKSDRYWAGISSDLAIETTLMRAMKTNGGLTRGRGFGEIQTVVWLMSRKSCLEVNTQMQEFTSTLYLTSEQHKESSKSRIERDRTDVKAILNYLDERNPFQSNRPELFNIATGVTAANGTNCHETVIVGQNILKDMIDKSVVQYTFRRAHRVKNMNVNIISIGGYEVNCDPSSLFHRFVALGADMDKNELFSYELCGYPPCLFENKQTMLKADKPSLADGLWNILPPPCRLSPDQLPKEKYSFVIDGGWLIHRLPWKKGDTYHTICDMYVKFLRSRYGNSVTVCFDGYGGISTKDSTHAVRTMSRKCTNVHVESHCVLNVRKTEFLINLNNKQSFIDLLSKTLAENRFAVHQSDADADVLIVSIACTEARSKDTILIGSDTDLLILLLSKDDVDSLTHRLYYRPETQKETIKTPRLWDIKMCRDNLGHLKKYPLFAHSFLGCDTTSRIYGQGKSSILSHVKSLDEATLVFNDPLSTSHDVIQAGERMILQLLGDSKVASLDHLRFEKYMVKIKTGHVHPCTLPPTCDAAKFHSLRVYHQVQAWTGNCLPPREWGWRIDEKGQCVPISTEKKGRA